MGSQLATAHLLIQVEGVHKAHWRQPAQGEGYAASVGGVGATGRLIAQGNVLLVFPLRKLSNLCASQTSFPALAAQPWHPTCTCPTAPAPLPCHRSVSPAPCTQVNLKRLERCP